MLEQCKFIFCKSRREIGQDSEENARNLRPYLHKTNKPKIKKTSRSNESTFAQKERKSNKGEKVKTKNILNEMRTDFSDLRSKIGKNDAEILKFITVRHSLTLQNFFLC